jgi:hypothetical protein
MAHKRLAALRPTDTSEAELYAAPSGKEVVGSLNVCNQDTSDASFRLAHTDGSGAAAGEDWICYDQDIAANSSITIGPISMYDGEYLRVVASVANKLSFVFSGMEI